MRTFELPATEEPKLPDLSVVIPVLNDAQELFALLECLQTVLPEAEVLVVDGGSVDLAADDLPASVRWAATDASRGRQLKLGSELAIAPWLWLLHADSQIDAHVVAELREYLKAPTSQWGRFDVAIDQLPIISWFVNHRSALTGICTGDQGIFVSQQALRSVGGIPDQPLMEDIELSVRLKRCGSPARLRGPLATSARRWRGRGVVTCVVQMWWFRLRYWAGAAPSTLAQDYYGSATEAPKPGELR